MKTIISLGLAVALSSSPVVELGATVAKAQSLKDAELSSQNANTNLLSETQNESTSSTDVNSDEPLNQETVKPTDEVTEDVTDEQPSQEVVESTDEVTEDVVDEQPSQEVVKPEDEVIENLVEKIDDENNIVTLTWDKLDIKDVTYSVYVKDNKNGENGFTLYENSLQENYISIPIKEDFNIDVYVIGSKDGKFSKQSNIINVKI